MLCVGAVHVKVTDFVGAVATVIVKGESDAVSFPSDTLIATFGYEPTFASVGVPNSVPDVASNDAHAGLPEMLNVKGSPSASLAVGLKA